MPVTVVTLSPSLVRGTTGKFNGAIPNVSVEAVLQAAGQKIKPSAKVQGR